MADKLSDGAQGTNRPTSGAPVAAEAVPVEVAMAAHDALPAVMRWAAIWAQQPWDSPTLLAYYREAVSTAGLEPLEIARGLAHHITLQDDMEVMVTDLELRRAGLPGLPAVRAKASILRSDPIMPGEGPRRAKSRGWRR